MVLAKTGVATLQFHREAEQARISSLAGCSGANVRGRLVKFMVPVDPARGARGCVLLPQLNPQRR